MSTRPVHIAAIAGSLRRGSFNRGLVRAAVELAPPGANVVPHDLRDVPLFDEDVEAAGLPPAVEALRDAIRRADALLLASPEYNGGYTAVMKNALDWASRKRPDNVLDGKPVLVVGATPGGFGTVRSQDALRTVLAHVGALPPARPAVRISRAEERFDADGDLVDPKSRDQLAEAVAALAAWTRRVAAEEV